MSDLRLAVIHTVDEHCLLNGCKRLLCCLSGGMDSTVLLHVMLSLQNRYGIQVFAVHVNHSIRGEEADRDEAFCRSLCDAWGVGFTSVKVNVPEYAASEGVSTELAARRLRYEAIERVMNDIGCDVAATAHNADDNAETLLFNIIRGTSPSGVAAIPYKRGKFVRPLLSASRSLIEAYAAANGIEYVTDSTNSDDLYTRNFIRHNIVPLCKQLNPSFVSAVTRLTDGAKSDNMLIEKSGIDKRREVVSFLEQNDICGVNNDVINKMTNAVKSGGSRVFTVSGGKRVAVVNGKLSIYRDADIAYTYDNEPLHMGENSFFGGAVTVCVEKTSENFREIYKSLTTVGFVSAIILNRLSVRNRMTGDFVTVCGVKKSVKKELINRKIPRDMRSMLPVVCVDGKIAFVPYVGVDDAFSPKGGEFLKISVTVKV